MTNFHSTHPRILSIAPSTRGFGFAVLEGLDTLADWGVKSVTADKNAQSIAKVKELLRDDQSDPFSLDEKESSLGEAEVNLQGHQEAFRKLRLRLVERRQRIALLQEEIQKRREQARSGGDIITGLWDVVSYPGPTKGTFDLALEGTFISGEYAFEGNWHGSLRGNLAGDRVRLERWDAETGFTAVYYGRLSVAEKALKGTWEATDLAGGKPASGTWVAHRRDE